VEKGVKSNSLVGLAKPRGLLSRLAANPSSSQGLGCDTAGAAALDRAGVQSPWAGCARPNERGGEEV